MASDAVRPVEQDEDEMAWPAGYEAGNHLPCPAYQRLPADYIRLLEILPGSPASQIRCRLTHAALNVQPSYIALSYTWGSGMAPRLVTLNGLEHAIGENLWRFLHHARKLGPKLKLLWIDALCINQHDLNEKDFQLQLMPDVYRTARKVLVWLGPQHHDSDNGLRILNRPSSQARKTMLGLWGTPAGSAVRGLCIRPYWGRLWIFQEVMLARDIEVMCGDTVIPWKHFREFMFELNNRAAPGRVEDKIEYLLTRQSLAMDIVLQTATGKQDDRSLWHLITAMSHLRCAEKRDHVYGLLGIANKGTTGIIPDYKMSLVVLLNNVLKRHHELQPPNDIKDVEFQGHELERALGLEQGSMFSLEGDRPLPLEKEIAEFPFDSPGSPITLWWAWYYKHDVVRSFWFDKKLFDGPECLRSAAKSGNEAVVKLLLDSGRTDVNSKDEDGEAPIHLASRHGHTAVLKLLLDTERVDVNSQSQGDITPLHSASFSGDETAVKLLLLRPDVDVNSKDTNRQTPLHLAAAAGREAIVNQLLNKSSVRVNSKDIDRKTPLHMAAAAGYDAIVKQLLNEASVPVNSKDAYSRTPLHLASIYGHEAIVKLLLRKATVDVNATDRTENTPLHLALSHKHTVIAALLLGETDIDVNMRDSTGKTPLHNAVLSGAESTVKLILKVATVNPDISDRMGRTPLSVATSKEHTAIVKLLLDTGRVYAGAKDDLGYTELMYASRGGYTANVQLLLETGKFPESTLGEPLWEAIQGSHQETVKVLLEWGGGFSSLQTARRKALQHGKFIKEVERLIVDRRAYILGKDGGFIHGKKEFGRREDRANFLNKE